MLYCAVKGDFYRRDTPCMSESYGCHKESSVVTCLPRSIGIREVIQSSGIVYSNASQQTYKMACKYRSLSLPFPYTPKQLKVRSPFLSTRTIRRRIYCQCPLPPARIFISNMSDPGRQSMTESAANTMMVCFI